MKKMKSVCVFCGSSEGSHAFYANAAKTLGKTLAENQVTLVYGGASVGTMGALADACLAAGGKVIGVVPRQLVSKEVAHQGLTELKVVDSMHERKIMMLELAEAFVALPGGFGTFDEITEVLSWAQLGLHQKPLGILNLRMFFSPLLSQFELAAKEEFISQKHLDFILVDDNPQTLLEKLSAFNPADLPRWIRSPSES